MGLHNKKYGLFFIAVQTRTGRIFVTKVTNAKTPTLLAAIGQMLQVKKKKIPPLPTKMKKNHIFAFLDQTFYTGSNTSV